MVYPTYAVDEDSQAPYTEIEVNVDPLVENNIDSDFDDKEVFDDDSDDECKDPNWNLPKGKNNPALQWKRVLWGRIRIWTRTSWYR